MHPAPECSERRRLRKQYHEALRAYVDATDALDPLEIEEHFERAYNIATFTRLAFERCREAYHRHVSEHACA